FEMSAPETNALPPAPESTTTRTSSSAANASSVRSTACHISSDTALRFSGLLKTTWPTPSSRRLMILSVMSVLRWLSTAGGRRSDHFGRAQLGDPPVAIAELVQNLVGVLAHQRRRHADARRRPAHDDRLADQLGVAALVRVHGLREAQMAHLRIGEHLIDGIDRAARHARLVQ